jgi:hypothetical protein
LCSSSGKKEADNRLIGGGTRFSGRRCSWGVLGVGALPFGAIVGLKEWRRWLLPVRLGWAAMAEEIKLDLVGK